MGNEYNFTVILSKKLKLSRIQYSDNYFKNLFKKNILTIFILKIYLNTPIIFIILLF